MAGYDAIVIGGGLVGTSTAYHLVHSGARTLLIDRTDVGRATDAGAGILSPETNTRDPEAWFNLATAAVDYYFTLIPQLQAEQEHETCYAVCGSLLVAASEDEREDFEAARRSIFARQQRLGMPSQEDLSEVSTEEAQGLFPPLAPPRIWRRPQSSRSTRRRPLVEPCLADRGQETRPDGQTGKR